MEGEIGVDSAAGSGSTFWFELPLQPADEAHLPRLPGASAPLVSPRRILVAEDVEINREIVKSVLERDGHEVAFAHDGAEALRLVQESGFDLVLMDIQMPIMDGVEATRLIRSLDGPVRDIPVVALTANVMAAEQEKYIAAGMNECLMKPIDWDRMRLAIGRYSVRT
jgi:CheY-like chemotaxis protein